SPCILEGNGRYWAPEPEILRSSPWAQMQLNAELQSMRQGKTPRKAGFSIFVTRSRLPPLLRRSEAILRGDAKQVRVAVERADQVGAAAGVGVVGGAVDRRAHVGGVHAERFGHVPGHAQGVDHAIVVGQARGAVLVVGRGLVVADAGAEGERIAVVPLA